jgi:hypothetical protein
VMYFVEHNITDLASVNRTVELSPQCLVFELYGVGIADGPVSEYSVIEASDDHVFLAPCLVAHRAGDAVWF